MLTIDAGRVLDNNNAHEMFDRVAAAQRDGFTTIIIDMTNLEFLSSAGVGSILGSIEASRQAGGDIILCNLSETIRHIFNVLDLTDYVTIKSDMQEVLNTMA